MRNPATRQNHGCAQTGKDDETLLFDLGGNGTKWVIGKDGSGRTMGGSADRPADQRTATGSAAMKHTGFRVVRGQAKKKTA